MGQPSTKENKKGSTRSYHHRRKLLIVTISIFFSASILLWWIRTQSHGLVSDEEYGTVADRPIRSIDYGVQSTTPVVMIRSALDEQLHNRFLEEHLYSCTETELNDIEEIDNRVKPPIYVYEGYFHSLATSEKVFSKNPNPLKGFDFEKPAASPFTRAFYGAFRHVNKEIFDTLKHELLSASSFNNVTKQEDVSYVLAKWIDEGRHFGDLSIQIHYGKGNEEKLKSGVAWHEDAANSLLHFAVTLRGSRVLHSRRIQTNSNATLRRPRNQQPPEVLERQNPGDVYLSSSTLMRHAPQFFDTDFDTRVIAIHARILYTSADVDHFYRVRTQDSWKKMTSVLANTLAAAKLRVPSLAQVESQLSLIA